MFAGDRARQAKADRRRSLSSALQPQEGINTTWVDPKEELVGVYMMQSVQHLLWYATTFKTLVEQAVVE